MTTGVVVLGSLLHLGFAIVEIFPLDGFPWVLRLVLQNKGIVINDPSEPFPQLAATIVRNAGVYNAILAAGFLISAWPKSFRIRLEPAALNALRTFFFLGAIAAGLFGLTLSPFTIVQAVLGAFGLCVIRFSN